MLYKSEIDKHIVEIRGLVSGFIELARSKQKNENYLLWVILGAHYYPNRQYNKPIGASNYEINNLDHLEPRNTHYKFISNYCHKAQLKENVVLGSDLATNIELTNQAESFVHYEMLLYLKIWEMDYLWCALYQLLRLIKSQEYDWYLKIVPKKN